MKKNLTIFVILGATIMIGIGLSIYGNQILFENLKQDEGTISLGKNLIVQTDFVESPSKGVFAVQVLGDKFKDVRVTVLDPYDIEIESFTLENDLYEGDFETTTEGSYKLNLEYFGDDEINIVGVIGPEPSPTAKSLAFISLYVLIIGLLGTGGFGIYAIKKRK